MHVYFHSHTEIIFSSSIFIFLGSPIISFSCFSLSFEIQNSYLLALLSYIVCWRKISMRVMEGKFLHIKRVLLIFCS